MATIKVYRFNGFRQWELTHEGAATSVSSVDDGTVTIETSARAAGKGKGAFRLILDREMLAKINGEVARLDAAKPRDNEG